MRGFSSLLILNMNIIQVLVLLIIIAILANFIHRSRNKRLYQLLQQFPSHKAYPLIGNAHLLLSSSEGFLGRVEKVFQPYDRLVFWLGRTPLIILKKHEDIVTVLNQCQDRDTYEIADKWVGVGLLTARYEEWKKSRKIVSPGFTSDMLSKYVDVFNKNASNFAQNLRPVADTGEQIDVLDWVMNANLDAAIENTMGVTIRKCGKKGEDFCNAMHEGLKHAVRRLQWPCLFFYSVDEIYLKITGKFKAIDHLQALPTEILRGKKKNYQDRQCQIDQDDQVNVDSSKTIIDLLVKSSLKEGFDETRLRNELLQIIAAGTETSALTLCFLMLMLAMNQDAQQKVYEEIIQIMDNDAISENHLTNGLEYLEQCVKETMRMFAPAVITSRRTQKEILLKDNTIVPKHTIVVPFIHFVNYDPTLYENPEKWDPEHFSKEAVRQRPKTSQLFFGYGPRSCIGARYAMMSLKIQIAHILRNYHLSTDVKNLTKQHLKMDIGIRSKIGYPIKLTSRQ